MNRIIYIVYCIIFISENSVAQNSEYILENYKPASPTAFQYQKYTDIPVSEYTGVPEISIPIYQVSTDEVKVPIVLRYQSNGIRVTEEASWVGLGWTMNFGVITQEINDRDDYDPQTIKKMPDWNESVIPTLYPRKFVHYSSSAGGELTQGWNDVDQIYSPKAIYSYRVYSAHPESISAPGPYFSDGIIGHSYHLPIEGHRDNPVRTEMIENPFYDSEPDIFTAVFFNHSVKFIKDFSSGSIKLLNNKGYKVVRSGESFFITVPDGSQYQFSQKSTVESFSTNSGGSEGYSNSPLLPSSKIWFLTKIISTNNKEIVFNYTQSTVVNNQPNVSQKWDIVENTITSINSGVSEVEGCIFENVGGISTSCNYSKENRTTISSIIFPNGKIIFDLSDRVDLLGAKKLDAIRIISSSMVKTFQFDYGYFDASSVGGEVYVPSVIGSYGSTVLRLKLLAMHDNTGATHEFTYSSILLPAKNSFAQDIWGFYNGKTANTSLIPNPALMNTAEFANLPDNGNNTLADINYISAGILNSIKYPTGGSLNFHYELNNFTNFPSTVSGNGLRIHFVEYKSDNLQLSKKTEYSYVGGKCLTPLKMVRTYPFVSVSVNSSNNQGTYPNLTVRSSTVTQVNGHGFFSTSALGSGNGVGYDKVIKKDIDINGNDIGRIETEFNNIPDKVGSASNSFTQIGISLPAIKSVSFTVEDPISDYPENGTVKSVSYFDHSNILKKSIINTYVTYCSPLYYGARFFNCAGVTFLAGSQLSNSHWVTLPRTLTGYYPIYDIKSLLFTSVTKEYDENNNSIEISDYYAYDIYNQVYFKNRKLSTDTDLEEYYEHAAGYFQRTNNNLLLQKNRLTEVTSFLKRNRKSYFGFTDYYSFKKDFQLQNGNFVPTTVTVSKDPTGIKSDIILYDQYDNKGNVLQFTEKSLTKSLIWGYNKEYVIAEIVNAPYNAVSFTSFEEDSDESWTYSGNGYLDATALTGKKQYSLNDGVITRSGLPANIYIVSYWKKNSSNTVLVNGSQAHLTGNTSNGFTYYEHQVNILASGIVTVSGDAIIDELRLYPKTALMSTYTYEPLKGITSKCDANNQILYFEYDEGSNRVLVRDRDRNIIEKTCATYTGKPENCTFFYNEPQNGAFVRNNCPINSIGTSVQYSIPAGMYVGSTQEKANKLAESYLLATGQEYANIHGLCNYIKPVITGANNPQDGVVSISFIPTADCYFASISYTDVTLQTPTQTNPSGCASPKSVSNLVYHHTYRFVITCHQGPGQPGVESDPIDVYVAH